jgi:hypothetical protein
VSLAKVLEHIHFRRLRRGRCESKRVTFLDAPRTKAPEALRHTDARWHTDEFKDPWPTRG